ncbi:MAG: inositol monophosphatase family protein [Sphingomonadales bacterium]
MTAPTKENLEQVALKAATAAGKILSSYFGEPLILEDKDAPSPIVTEADFETEKELRKVIWQAFPDHNIWGEELGLVDKGSVFTWVLDPLDGTIAFINGKPLFTTLIAVCENNTPILGVMTQPILDYQWIGRKNDSTRFGAKPAKTSGAKSLAETRLSTTDPYLFSKEKSKTWFEVLKDRAKVTSYGGDAFAYGLLANGAVDLIIESELSWHDAAALIPIVEGAGGFITDFDGKPLNPATRFFDVIAAASEELLVEALSLKP